MDRDDKKKIRHIWRTDIAVSVQLDLIYWDCIVSTECNSSLNIISSV